MIKPNLVPDIVGYCQSLNSEKYKIVISFYFIFFKFLFYFISFLFIFYFFISLFLYLKKIKLLLYKLIPNIYIPNFRRGTTSIQGFRRK